METQKKSIRILTAAVALVFLGACSSQSNLPSDDIYYSTKSANSTRVQQNNDQESSEVTVPGRPSEKAADNSFDYTTQYQNETVAGTVPPTDEGDLQYQSEDDGEYEYIDEHYDNISYADQINRFDRNEGSSFSYYDNYYSGCGGCGSSWSFNTVMGYGGWGWSSGYGYGWPYYGWSYPSYYWGYPYYGWGYPYHSWGYGSYWGGYNNGYYNGYWDGYYAGGGYGGGYYNDYTGHRNNYYGPRGGNSKGGTNVPRSRSASKDDEDRMSRQRGGTVVASSDGRNSGIDGGNGSTLSNRVSTSDNKLEKPVQRPEESVRINTTENQSARTEQRKLEKPVSKQTEDTRLRTSGDQAVRTNEAPRSNEPRYKKPKSYESLPARQPRSSKEYVRPAESNTSNSRSNQNTFDNRRSTPNSNNSGTTKSNSSYRNTNDRSGSVSTPTRSTTSSPKSYNAPTRNSGSSTSSYSTPSRSSSSGGSSSSRSSGSSSGGGGRRR